MEITVFAKKRTTKEGKAFFTYLTRLMRKDGTEVSASVKFRDNGCGVPRPEDCPCNIIIENKSDANFSSKMLVNEATGETVVSNTLWISAWKHGSAYVDKSMDDFM